MRRMRIRTRKHQLVMNLDYRRSGGTGRRIIIISAHLLLLSIEYNCTENENERDDDSFSFG